MSRCRCSCSCSCSCSGILDFGVGEMDGGLRRMGRDEEVGGE